MILCSSLYSNSIIEDFFYKVENTWKTSEQKELYIPVWTWHNRLFYDKEKTDNYNERPWGIGGAISKYDEKGNYNSIGAIVFKDSHNKFQPMVAYTWKKMFRQEQNIRFGLGYMASLTARDDWFHYKIIVPGILPVASINYKKDFAINATYIPGTYNYANVLFVWLTYKF